MSDLGDDVRDEIGNLRLEWPKFPSPSHPQMVADLENSRRLFEKLAKAEE